MVRPLRACLVLATLLSLAVGVGCGSDSDSSADATTAATPSATTAPATTAPATTAPATTAPETTTAPAGDSAAGESVFAATCTGCHLNNGNDAGGVGPKLAGAGLAAGTVRNRVISGGGAMPAGLASGTDLDNVVAYVVSLQ